MLRIDVPYRTIRIIRAIRTTPHRALEKLQLRVFPRRGLGLTLNINHLPYSGLTLLQLHPRLTPRMPPADFTPFSSRRSTVHSTAGIVACTQPLAAAAGQTILKEGGNAAVCILQ